MFFFLICRLVWRTSDGGSISFDWVVNQNDDDHVLLGNETNGGEGVSVSDDDTPTIVIIPGFESMLLLNLFFSFRFVLPFVTQKYKHIIRW